MSSLTLLLLLTYITIKLNAISIRPEWVCLNDIKTCLDGTRLERERNIGCEFPECPIVMTPCSDPNECINPINGECSYMAPCPSREYCTKDIRSPFYTICNAYPSSQCRFTTCGGCKEYFVDKIGNIINDCDIDICLLPFDSGLCEAIISKYFYNSITKQCEQFNYGGCDGNANRFDTLIECENACGGPQEGDSCTNCIRPMCACGLCPDGMNSFGCCGGCKYERNINGNLQCVYEGNTKCPVCADMSCKPGTGHICYDTSKGPTCCDPNICATGGECGGALGLICKPGYECVNNPLSPCLGGPTGTLCPKICINPDGMLPIPTPTPTLTPKCCDPLQRPDGLNGNRWCFEGTACCPDGSWSCSIGDGKTFPCNGIQLNIQKSPQLFGKVCNNCPIGQCLNPYGICSGSVMCFANPCQVNNCPAAAICESNYCGGCYAVFKDINGDIIEPHNCMINNNIGCGINHCNSYYDGCNNCGCTPSGIPLCTMRACHPLEMTVSICTGCEAGYELNEVTNQCEKCKIGYIWNPSTKKCEACMCTMQYDPVCCNDGNTYSNACNARCQHANGCNPGSCPILSSVPLICGGFENCSNYNDGCNDCICGNNGNDLCTTKACFVQATPQCTQCKSGYTLDRGYCIV